MLNTASEVAKRLTEIVVNTKPSSGGSNQSFNATEFQSNIITKLINTTLNNPNLTDKEKYETLEGIISKVTESIFNNPNLTEDKKEELLKKGIIEPAVNATLNNPNLTDKEENEAVKDIIISSAEQICEIPNVNATQIIKEGIIKPTLDIIKAPEDIKEKYAEVSSNALIVYKALSDYLKASTDEQKQKWVKQWKEKKQLQNATETIKKYLGCPDPKKGTSADQNNTNKHKNSQKACKQAIINVFECKDLNKRLCKEFSTLEDALTKADKSLPLSADEIQRILEDIRKYLIPPGSPFKLGKILLWLEY